MNTTDLKNRTKEFALRVINLYKNLPEQKIAEVTGLQLLRSASSVGANYRAACRARSKADFISKMTIVEEEANECCYWLELMVESNIIPKQRVVSLYKEANELTAIVVSSVKTARANNPKSTIRNPK